MKHIPTFEGFLNESHPWNPSMKKPIFGSGGNGTSQEYLEGLWKNRNFDIPSSFFEDADKETNKSKQEELIKILGLICDAHNTEKEALRIGEYFLEMWRKKNNLEYDKKAVFESFLNEGFQADVKDIHFETDPDKQEQLKKAYGKSTGAMSTKSQIESADYALAKFRKEIKYDNGKSGSEGITGVFIPGSSMAAFSTAGNGPHSKPKKWNQKEYDKWIKDMSGDGGADHAYDMAQNAKFEPGLIDWVKRNVAYGEKPLDRIQWDIEAYS